MHEWALAEAVLEELKKHVDGKAGQSVQQVVLTFGELQKVDKDIFLEGLAFLLPDSGLPAGKDVFVCTDEPVAFSCGRCGFGWTLNSMTHLSDEEKESIHFLPETIYSYVTCPECASVDYVIEKGRGVTIQSIDILAPKE